MRASLVLALALLAGARVAAAAETPKVELFGGYSYTKDGDESLHGGEVSLDVRINRWIAAEADVSDHFGGELSVSRSRLFFLGGLRFAYRTSSLAVFTHYLAGGARSRAGITVAGVDISESRTDFAMAFGGGVDVRLADRWAARAQADYTTIHSEGGSDNEPRFSAGVVYRFP